MRGSNQTAIYSENMGHPAPHAVREQLERILNSPEFPGHDRRQAFLNYVVGETLAGRPDRLKGYSIGVSVYNRDENFDPNTDPVVRLEARRLRRDLEHYYLTVGRDDPIRISIPKGAYVPVFEYAAGQSEQPERPGIIPPEQPAATGRWRRSLGIAVVSAAVVAVGLGGALWLTSAHGPDLVPQGTDDAVLYSASPTIAVLPLEKIGPVTSVYDLATGLAEDIVTDLSRISGLQVIAYSSSARFGNRDLDNSKIGAALGATHLLRGSIQIVDDNYRVNTHLIDVASRQQIWAKRFDYSHVGLFASHGQIANDIRNALAVTLLSGASLKTGGTRMKNLEARSLYRQALTLVNPPNDAARFIASNVLFRRIIELEPDSAKGYAGLAFVLSLTTLFGHAKDGVATLDEVGRLSAEAINIDPENSLALIAQGLLALLEGAHDRAIELCRIAVEKRPSSSHAHAFHGIMLTFAGRASEGIQSLQKAMRLDPVNARVPFLNMLGLAYFHAGDYAAALASFQRNIERGGPIGPHMLVYIAATHAALGDAQMEQNVLRTLRENPSSFSVETWLRRAYRDPGEIERLLTVLKKI